MCLEANGQQNQGEKASFLNFLTSCLTFLGGCKMQASVKNRKIWDRALIA